MKLRLGAYLKTPLPLWLSICIALFFTLTLVAFTASQLGLEERKKELELTLKEQSWRSLQMLSAGALEPVISEDIAQLETLVTELSRFDPDLSSIAILNESSQVLYSWTNSDVHNNPELYAYEIDMEFEGELFGHINASWNPARLLQKIANDLVQERTRLISALLTLTALSLLLIHLLIVSPLNKLRKRLEALSRGSQFEPIAISSSRELSMLANAVYKLDKTMVESRNLSLELEYQAKHDILTGLINRYAFEKCLKEHLETRTADQTEATLLYIDLDQFKLVNDTCGHAAGDALLAQLASILKQQLKGDDMFARLGGDEFAIFLPDTPLDKGLEIAENIRNAAQAFRFSWEGRSFVVEVSIGVVPVNQQGDNCERLLSAADEACYSAKNEGRNRVNCYQEDDEELRLRRDQGSWIPQIVDAIETSRLILYAQPIEPTDSNLEQGGHIEILVRMLNQSDELVPPGAFLPAAERYGLMPQIDRSVITQTIEWLLVESSSDTMPPVCSINISGVSICDPDFRQFVFDCLTDNPKLRDFLSFEITETAAVANLSSAVEFMQQIKQLGCSFSLDDFGSGMSSFTYLKNLPVDYVKIDGSFVQNMLLDPTSLAMVRAISDIVGVMQIQSVAEYVENQEIRDKLLEMGIDFVQGFGVGRPAPLATYEAARNLIKKAA